LSIALEGAEIKLMKNKTILVVAAHPDDEILGCGGTIARHVIAGATCHVLILGEGITSRDVIRNEDVQKNKIVELNRQAKQAACIIGVTSLEIDSFPDNRMDSVDLLNVVKRIETAIGKFKPEIIYTHHFGDLNIDHRVIARAVVTATRPIGQIRVREIYAFETPSSTEWAFTNPYEHFRPNCFVNIEKTLDKKIKALNAYLSEKRDFPHPRSSEALTSLAKVRGVQAGFEAAEAFCLIRKLG
jgi:LmbE family N-acetylglucosaminyl deacetylase